ncbi:hypothetical protein ACO0LF_29325 [Undibacterium sp. Di27W]|uniref:hypothetical protein n=1 Tax=Undibacterium sp. Di27W TaxID=3413036 RepID=UPI003BF2E4B8
MGNHDEEAAMESNRKPRTYTQQGLAGKPMFLIFHRLHLPVRQLHWVSKPAMKVAAGVDVNRRSKAAYLVTAWLFGL